MKLVEHLGELARWPLVARVRALLLGQIVFFSVGLGMFLFSLFLQGETQASLVLRLGGFPKLLALACAVWFFLFLAGHLMQRSRPESRAYGALAFTALIGFNGLLFIEIGMFSSVIWGSMMGAAAIGFAIFEKKAVWLAFFGVLGIFAANSLSIVYGDLFYKDLISTLTGTPIKVSGSWLAMQWLTTGPIAVLGVWLLGVLLGGWHEREKRFENASITDPLTKVFNRRRFMERLQQLCESERKGEDRFAVALFDLDHFKQINDTYGHGVGDQALQSVAKTLKDTLRDDDLIARYGGEEFVALLPGCDSSTAFAIVERCRQAIESKPLSSKNNGAISITASAGISVAGSNVVPAEKLLADADKALYQAKEAGRNRTVLSGGSAE